MDPIGGWTVDFFKHFDEEVAGTSDRGTVILAAAGIDAALGEVISGACREGVDPGLVLDKDAAGGTFSARTNLAKAIGLISDDEFYDINLIRRIRNQMAHGTHRASFEDMSVRDRCAEFRLVDRIHLPDFLPFATAPDGTKFIPTDFSKLDDVVLPVVDFTAPLPTEPRKRFVAETKCLLRALAARHSLAERRPAPDEFMSALAPDLVIADIYDRVRTEARHLKAENLVLKRKLVELTGTGPEADAVADEVGAMATEPADEVRERVADMTLAAVNFMAELHRRAQL